MKVHRPLFRFTVLTVLLLLLTVIGCGCSSGKTLLNESSASQSSSAVLPNHSASSQSSSSNSQSGSISSQNGSKDSQASASSVPAEDSKISDSSAEPTETVESVEVISSDAQNEADEPEEETIRATVLDAIDSYKGFIDEYCSFIESIDLSISGSLEKLQSMLAKELEMTEKFNALEDTDMNTKELEYYSDVSLRCASKLLEYAEKVSDLTSRANTGTDEKTNANEEPEENGASGIRPDVKAAIDSYEAFVDEYCEFMNSYDKNDLSQLTSYLSLLAKEIEMEEQFDALEQDLNDQELLYYSEVSLRCSQKLLDLLKD